MKKVLGKLLVLTLGVTALSSCDLFSLGGEQTAVIRGDEDHEVKGLVLKNYSSSVYQGSNYLFDGKAYLSYVDSSIEDLDVTSECTFTTVDTSSVGTQSFKVSYEGSKYIYSKSTHINVIGLDSIELKDYSKEVKQNETYAFKGKVIATFSDNSTKDVTHECNIDMSKINTKVVDTYPLTVSYQAGSTTLTSTVDISVYGLKSIKVENYSSHIKKGESYSFNGRVTVYYTNDTFKVVTTIATIDESAVNTAVEGKYPVHISYTDGGVTLSETIEINVYESRPKLSKIVASGYTNEVEKGDSYSFDGVVTATFEDGTTEVVTNSCTYGSIVTSSVGTKSLSITYKTFYTDNSGKEISTSKSTTASINVISTLKSISGDALTVGINRTKTISLSFTPSDATNKNVSYTSNDTSIATVSSDGKVTGKAIGNTTITVTSQLNSSITTTVPVEVAAVANDAWTILLYVSGNNLESDSWGGGAATDDLQEIASVSGQPEDVNIIVQAGGASSWRSTYSSVINASKRNRIYLKDKKYYRADDGLTSKVNMGAQDTFQDFVEWGINNYPADRMALIMWNHGGAMGGCCGDEQFGQDYLTPDEMTNGLRNARANTGYTDKFEFIGYDCCLMQVQDIAGNNAEFAKYQAASEASEWGDGWAYDGWIDDVYAGKSTTAVLTEVVDSFKRSSPGSDQTMSYVDLSNWDVYEDAWEDMISTINISSSSDWTTFKNVVKSAQTFESGSFDTYDAGHFFSKMRESSSYKNNTAVMNKLSAVEAAYSNLIGHSWHGSSYTDAKITGLCVFCPINGSISKNDYSTDATPFTVYRNVCLEYGSFYGGGWY